MLPLAQNKMLELAGIAPGGLPHWDRCEGTIWNGSGRLGRGLDAVAPSEIEVDKPGWRAARGPGPGERIRRAAEPICVFHAGHPGSQAGARSVSLSRDACRMVR